MRIIERLQQANAAYDQALLSDDESAFELAADRRLDVEDEALESKHVELRDKVAILVRGARGGICVNEAVARLKL